MERKARDFKLKFHPSLKHNDNNGKRIKGIKKIYENKEKQERKKRFKLAITFNLQK